MKFAAILVIPLLFLLAGALAQEEPQPPPLVSSDLVAWSSMQQLWSGSRPAACLEPVHASAAVEAEPLRAHAAPHRASQNQHSAGTSDRAVPSAEVFSGSVVKEADNFMLKVSRTTSYTLDNPEQTQQFERQQVRVIGTLDRDQHLIHVHTIEPLS